MSKNEGHELLRGHVDECFGSLVRRLLSQVPKGAIGAVEAKKPLADFCGVQVDSIARWMRKTAKPNGEERLKLMFFLELQGYTVIELERMKRGRRSFGELIAFGLLTTQQATEYLGYSNPSTMYQMFFGQAGASEAKDQLMWEAGKERRELLEQRKAEAAQRYKMDLRFNPPPQLPSPPERQPPTVTSDDWAPTLKVMDALTEMLEQRNIDQLSSSQLSSLRPESRRMVLRLLSHLNGMAAKLISNGSNTGGG